MPLSTLDLVSTCCGRLSFGFSLWYALPQIGKLYEEKSGQDGPSFQFLTMWLVGDIAQTIGLFAIGGLSTQKASGICFAVSSLIIMLQQLYYRGYVPLTGRYKARIRKPVISQLVTTTHREPAYTIDPPTNDPEHTQFVKSLLNRANDLEKGHKTSRHQSSTYKQRSIEKKVPRDKKRVRSKAKKGWIKADGKSFNFTGFFLVTVVMMIVWFKVDFENRKTTNLELAPFPGTLAEWVGWALGWIGTALYNYPRVHQLIGIQLSKSVSSLAAFMFASLVLQNITILISIAAVSHTLETAPAQAPYYTNLACALTSDFLVLYRLYRNNPSSRKRLWSDPNWMYQDDKSPLKASTGERAIVQNHQQVLHTSLIPSIPSHLSDLRGDHKLPSNQARLRKEVEENARRQLRRQLDLVEKEAFALESQWTEESSSLSWMNKRRVAWQKLDPLEAREAKLWSSFEVAMRDKMSEPERQENEKWMTSTERRRRALEVLRKERHREMESWGKAESSSETEHDEGSEDSSSTAYSEKEHRRLYRPSSGRRASVGRGKTHPRRGVGTLSSENESSSSG